MNKYQHMDTAINIQNEFKKIEDYYNSNRSYFSNIEELKKKDKEEAVKDFYIEFGSENKEVNDTRVKRNNIFIIMCLLSLILVGICGIISFYHEKPTEVYIMNNSEQRREMKDNDRKCKQYRCNKYYNIHNKYNTSTKTKNSIE